jgi:hypothetical protein
MRQLMLASRFGDYEFQWLKRYGPVYRLNGCFGVSYCSPELLLKLSFPQQDRLMVADPTALQYILNSPSFYRSPLKDNIAYLLFGEKSVISARGRSSLLPLLFLRYEYQYDP